MPTLLLSKPGAWLPIITVACMLLSGVGASAQEEDEEQYKAEIPDVSIYKAMLDANEKSGWIQFRNYDGRQLIYFTALQTMHCRLSEIRYSINSDALDQRFPLAKCDPQLPFNLPSDDTADYIYISLKAGEAETVAVQAVWDDGSGSQIVVYKPCEGTGDATCAAIKTIKKSKKQTAEPSPSSAAR
ncbi:hypothetical protein [Sinorhizobium sp. BG8]|uniref:hypothetical protein n=1 Tax=Sinorhizobium sp. BG8 TaxID=2613773 RepID=UPI00193E87B2|nr:hypothetical protein [Sinorhizobium sp. BG8]QRM53691.1 hypothetical protein F3Y30_03265 [Sinorhizobium sp. BG8]